MSLQKFNLVELISKFNHGEKNVCAHLMSEVEREHFNDFQFMVYLSRYALYNETPTELFERCCKHISTKPIPRLMDSLLQQKIVFSGHRLLQYGYGDTEACLTVSFDSFPKAINGIMDFMKGHISCGIEITDPNVSKGLFAALENLTKIYEAPRSNHINNTNMKYRFNLIVNIASVSVLDIIEELMPTSRNSLVENLVTISLLDDFITAVNKNTDWKLYNLDKRIPTSAAYRELKNPVKIIPARELMNKICRSILSVGKPSLIYLDLLNEKLHTQLPFFKLNDRCITTTNLCCEIALPTLPNEIATCNISAVNLKDVTSFDEAFDRAKLLTKAMNSTILNSTYDYSLKYRPLGIGTLGVFDCYTNLRKTHTHIESLKIIDDLFFGVYLGSLISSMEEAKERGSFCDFQKIDYRKYPKLVALSERAKSFGKLKEFEDSFDYRFNLTLTAQPPTANMAMLCDTSPSLEPCEHNYYIRANHTFFKIKTPDCGIPLWQKTALMEKFIELFSAYCDQTISANAIIREETMLSKFLTKRRKYSPTALYYARVYRANATILCDSCSV